MRVASRDAEFVIRPRLAETDQLDSRIGIKVDKAAFGRAGGNAAKDADASVIALGNTIKLLLDYRPYAEIATQHRRRAAARWAGERDAVRRKAQIAKRGEIPPAAEFDASRQIGIALFVVPVILNLSHHE